MAVSKYFGEERCDDAIYSIYLKKVRYVPVNNRKFFMEQHDDNREHVDCNVDCDQLQWETIKERVIRAGTIKKLVDCVLVENVMDSRHFNVFFATYRAFATVDVVLDLIIKRYESVGKDIESISNDSSVKNSIRALIFCWVEMFPEDFYEPSTDFASLTELLNFARVNKISDLRSKARRMRETFKRIVTDGGLLAQIPSMSHYVVGDGYRATNYAAYQERANLFDVEMGNCAQIAEQLTFWDAELFKELLPQQCQGYIWSKRHKNGLETVYSVKATIDQFNAVVQKVMTSIVLPNCSSEYRSKIISKWIEVARELRTLKNFSSLKAVLSSLQSEPVYRLKSIWSCLPSGCIAQFSMLSSIFQVDENGKEKNIKEILEEVDTGKSSTVIRKQIFPNCRRYRSDYNLVECHGTVPYLGSFLTDLSMIDQASSDFTEDGLINFEKRRKEFEVMAKIRLFQSACRGYNIPMDAAFCSWFLFLPALDENQCFIRSLQIETGSNAVKQPQKSLFHSPKINSLARIFSSGGGHDNHSFEIRLSSDSGIVNDESWSSESAKPIRSSRSFTAPSTPANSVSWKGSEFNPKNFVTHARSSSSSSTARSKNCQTQAIASDTADCSSSTIDVLSHTIDRKLRKMRRVPSTLNSSTSSHSTASSSSVCAHSLPFQLARVALDDLIQQSSSLPTNYKCIKVENSDRINCLIERILEKYSIDGDPNEYFLVQLLPDGCEFHLPDRCNPFYAVAPDTSSAMLNFILRRRSDYDGQQASVAPSMKKLNLIKRNNLLRWNSGYL